MQQFRVMIVLWCCLPLLILRSGYSWAADAEPPRLSLKPVVEQAPGGGPQLPDFSYAGYARGERPIPDEAGPIFNVVNYGAVPDSGRPAYAGIQRAIEACEAAGGGVVWFPRGVYRVNPPPADATAPRLRVRANGVVLRGAGSGRDGSVLFMEAEIQPTDPAKMWSGQPALLVEPSWSANPATPVGQLVGQVAMNQRRIPVQSGHDIHPGDRINLLNRVAIEDLQALNRRIAPRTWGPTWNKGIDLAERHVVASVEPDAIVLHEVLLTPIAEDQRWTIERTRMLQGIGIEGLRFQGNWQETFSHHHDWRHDSAWRGIIMRQVEDSWIRNCVFEDMNWPIQYVGSRNCTNEKLAFSGTPGHFGIQVTSSTNVLNLAIHDEAGHFHGPSLQSGSAGTVYHRAIWRDEGCLDSHAGCSYANLFELGTGGLVLGACGGNIAAFPHHLHACVVWNHHQTSLNTKPQEFWPEKVDSGSKTFLQVMLIGLTGPRPDLRQVGYEESTGIQVEPKSLWLAQLRSRLGQIPEHFRGYAYGSP